MLACIDLPEAVRFYVEKLGFNCNAMHGNPPVWADVERNGVSVMLNAPPAECVRRDVSRSSRDYQIYYFDAEGVVELHAKFASRGVAVSPLRVAFYGMKEFEVRDPEGHWLWFAEPTDEAPSEKE
ncbi:MAG: VOC family protein [Phycisphaerales bacterium]|nr:VOC family protein [Phycisphaerales bacterium]